MEKAVHKSGLEKGQGKRCKMPENNFHSVCEWFKPHAVVVEGKHGCTLQVACACIGFFLFVSSFFLFLSKCHSFNNFFSSTLSMCQWLFISVCCLPCYSQCLRNFEALNCVFVGFLDAKNFVAFNPLHLPYFKKRERVSRQFTKLKSKS